MRGSPSCGIGRNSSRGCSRSPGTRPTPFAAPGPQVDDTLWRAIQRLPREQREAVVLFYYEDLTTEAVGRVVGASPGAVRTRLSRARDHLRSLLEVEWDG